MRALLFSCFALSLTASSAFAQKPAKPWEAFPIAKCTGEMTTKQGARTPTMVAVFKVDMSGTEKVLVVVDWPTLGPKGSQAQLFDATGTLSSTQFDIFGRPVSLNDGKSQSISMFLVAGGMVGLNTPLVCDVQHQ